MKPQDRPEAERSAPMEPPHGREPDLQVEIRQYQTLLDILDKPKKALKVIAAIVVLALAIFMALAFTTIAIKRFYPYNEIKTNMFGATTMQNEEVELTYWLFNTADLWGNSGIRVERGDQLTIRASGKSNTSIHHLVDNAYFNSRPRYRWVGTEGEPRPANTRTAYRIYEKRDPDALIMQVVPEDNSDELPEAYLRPDLVPPIEGEKDPYDRFYYIGKERTNLIINQSGTLRFAVNDIVLTDRCIDSMMRHNDLLFRDRYGEKEYIRLLLLRHDTVALERIFRNEFLARYTSTLLQEKKAWSATVWKGDGSGAVEQATLTKWLKACDRECRDLLPSLADTSQYWEIGTDLYNLRKQCDTLRTFYHAIRVRNQIDRNDPLYRQFGTYLSKHSRTIARIDTAYASKDARWLFERPERLQKFKEICRKLYDELQEELEESVAKVGPLCEKWRNTNEDGLYFGPHPVRLISGIDDSATALSALAANPEEVRSSVYPFYNEMTYYRETHYFDAWYEDNVGSFLIVVERRKNSSR